MKSQIKILVIGSGGMLGHMLTLYFSEKGYEVKDISHYTKCRESTCTFDVQDENIMKKYLDAHQFDFVINCAAFLVSESEKRKEDAIKLNSYFPHWLERYYENTDTRIVQVSTAGVYYGDIGHYDENARHDSMIFYGRTKSLGELNNSKDLTVRSDFWGPDIKKNGVGLFNWAMSIEKNVNGYNEVYVNGISSLEFAKFIEATFNNWVSGSINLGSIDDISKADLLKKIYYYMDKETNVNYCVSAKRNTTVKSCRSDCSYKFKTFDTQLSELKKWIDSHKDIYSHYYK